MKLNIQDSKFPGLGWGTFPTLVRFFFHGCVLLLCCIGSPAMSQIHKTIEFQNGRWFNGNEFVIQVMYSENGVFRSIKPLKLDTVIDLGGKYLVPPYGDAHNHLIDPDVKGTIAQYLKDGIFYVMDHGSVPVIYNRYKQEVNKPGSIDMISPIYFFTGNDGHPEEILDNAAKNGMVPKDWATNKFAYGICEVDSLSELDSFFPEVLKAKPDFIKAMLLYSDEYDSRKKDSVFRYHRGMNPRLLPDLAKRAHEAGLRVSVHIESRADFLTAVHAGVDVIAHMPGMGFEAGSRLQEFLITKEDARLCAKKNIAVITTLSFLKYLTTRKKYENIIKNEIMLPNMKLLRESGVNLVIGVDQFHQTSKEEALFISELGWFTNLELLSIWCEATPRMIFPARKIGKLHEGYESSFLLLDGNPLDDFQNTTRINQRWQKGILLRP